MYASTVGGGAMSLIFRPKDPDKKGSKTSIKLPDTKKSAKRAKVKKTA